MLVSPLVLGQIAGGWPRGLASRLPGLRVIHGQPALSIGSVRSRIGRVRDDGTFWVQPLILHEPPRLCTWDASQIGFRSSHWRREAVALMKRRVPGCIAEVLVQRHRREPWAVTFVTDVGQPKSFGMPADLLDGGLAYAKDPHNVVYQRIEADARSHHRGMFHG